MATWSERTELLLGKEKLAKFADSHVLVVGLGGVGAYAAELICRAGIGKLTIIDGDVVEETNKNRQLPALTSNIGKPKSAVVADRLREINPDAEIITIQEFIRNERIPEIISQGFDYVVDAIDILSHKVSLIATCLEMEVEIVSSMGAGGKMDPSQIRIVDIEESYNCRLAKMVRKRLHKRGVYGGFQVVFSPEDVSGEIIRVTDDEKNDAEDITKIKSTVGTISYMPALFGCHCASVVLRALAEK